MASKQAYVRKNIQYEAAGRLALWFFSPWGAAKTPVWERLKFWLSASEHELVAENIIKLQLRCLEDAKAASQILRELK